MATIQYARLYPDSTQLQAKDGHNLTAGWVEVYLAGTDDPAVTYADYNGTRNPQRIVVDDNGRFCAIVDKSKAYRVEVYDADGALQWTTEPVWCTGNAGAGMSVTRVISTDGSIAVEENIDGSERTYDLSIAPSDSDEFLEWIKCSEEDCGSTWHPVYQAGTMETEAGQGIKVHAGQLYHFTNTFYVDPNGTGINYDTFKVMMYCNDEIVDVRDFDIDSSLNDSVMCEFSTDLIPEADGVVYYKLTIPSTCEVTGEVQCHRIYSGINAVPDTCATKQWVQETFDYNMSEKISYSALEYNDNGDISGISGSAIAGGLDSAAVSAIASSYAESAISSISSWSGDLSSISSKIDWSSSGVFQPSGDYQTAGDYAYNSSLSSKADQSAFEQCCDEVHSALDEKLDKSASSEFQPSGQYVYESAYSSFSSEVTNNISSISSAVSGLTGQYIEQSASGMFQPSGSYVSATDMSAYVPFSGLEGEGGKVTGISGSAFKGHEYTGILPVVVDNTADTISVEHRTLCVDSTMTAYNSGSSAVIGVNVAGLDLSSKMDASASSLFYSTSNPSGFVTGVDLTPYQLTADMSAYAHESSLSAKLDASASSAFYGTANPSGFIDGSSASAIASAYQIVSSTATQLYAGTAYLTSVNDAPISASRAGNAANASLANSAWYDGTGRLISSLPDEATVSGIASAYAESAASGKLDTTAQVVTSTASASSVDFGYTSYYMTGLNGLNLFANKAVSATYANHANEAISATNWLGESSKLDSSASSSFYTTANESGYIDSAYVEGQVSSKQDVSAMSAYALSSDVSGVIDTVSSNSASWAGGITGDYLTAKVGSGQATFTTAFQDEMEKRPSLVISAERSAGAKMYPRMMVTDWNGTTGDTHSGMLLANAFEFYICPQSARGQVDPSGLVQSRLDASQLQFNIDSAVSSFTRSAEFTRSGMRLGMSANTASWVSISGNGSSGGFITLDDGSGTSGRIVASSIPYWNDKLDGSASSSYYTTANESGYVDSAYVDSQVSGVIDTVSSNSASWAGGGGVDSATVSAIASAYAESAASGKQASGEYISAVGFGQAIRNKNNNSTEYIAFGDPTPGMSTRHAGLWLTGQFGTAYYKDNELNLNRGSMKIAFNVGGSGPKISAMALSSAHSYMYLFASGNNSGTYSETGITFKDSGNNIVALYDSATYSNITSVYDTVSANSASWGGGGGGVDSATVSAIASSYAESATSGKVDQSAYDDLYSAFTALNDLVSQYSAYFSSISAKVDNSAIGVIE